MRRVIGKVVAYELSRITRDVGDQADLTLAKRFIELHGGRIWVEIEVGKGTTFTFAVPLGRTAIPN